MITLVDKPGPISLIDETFDPSKSVNYSLHLLADEQGMDAALLDKIGQRWVGLNSPYKTGWLETNFNSAHFYWIGNKFTLVPFALYEEAKKRSYLELACGEIKDLQVEAVPLPTCNAILVYGIPMTVISEAKKAFGNNLNFMHQSQITIESILQANKNKPGRKVYAIVHSGELEILVSDGHQLILYNVYSYQTTDEAVYHIMNTLEVLQLNPEFVPVILGGHAYKNSALFELVYKYVRHTEHLALPELAAYTYSITELPPHRFYSLFAQVVCAS